MARLFLFIASLVIVATHTAAEEDGCAYCVGDEFECVNGHCYCAYKFVPNFYQNTCVKCPALGEKCYGPCCSEHGNETLQCWHGVCQKCYGPHGNWICRDPIDQIILISGSQIIMAAALVLGIFATFILLYKMCAATSIRGLGTRSVNCEGRLSVGSLQIHVDERLRDAPPRYSRAAPAGSAIYPAAVYLNAGFIHDNSLPPPPYSAERKDETSQNTTLHL
ncbi:uncharacterized protein LOC121726926 [Aricia agestis]|uniref:uncharacterized protein LOC121726926 n=1 Tax=Aricia agestis TaxID=91739 RepID=UPI001C2018E7|nr:uncharacterized protein LOC121726926 [Aricia agestis]